VWMDAADARKAEGARDEIYIITRHIRHIIIIIIIIIIIVVIIIYANQ